MKSFPKITAKITKHFKDRTVQTLFLCLIYFLLAPYFSQQTHRFFYTISIVIKDVLIAMTPFTVFILISSALGSFQRKAPKFILLLFGFEMLSNCSSVFYAYVMGSTALSQLPECPNIITGAALTPLWQFPFSRPIWWRADYGTLASVFVGCIQAIKPIAPLGRFLQGGKKILEFLLIKCIARTIPLFVLGFVARMYCSGFLNKALFDCGTLVLLIVFSLVSYILFIFLLGNRFQVRNAFSDFKNMAPAGIIAFTSGCSLSTMPTTIEGTAKNLQDPSLANALIPATTNIQQIGDCLANSLLCFWIYQSFFCVAPSFSTWASFSFVFVLARFTTVAVLGGAIFIMLPIYKHYLNFNDDMIAIIVAFNVILDPIITSANVLANGALAKVFERCWIFLSRGKDVLPGKQ